MTNYFFLQSVVTILRMHDDDLVCGICIVANGTDKLIEEHQKVLQYRMGGDLRLFGPQSTTPCLDTTICWFAYNTRRISTDDGNVLHRDGLTVSTRKLHKTVLVKYRFLFFALGKKQQGKSPISLLIDDLMWLIFRQLSE